MLDRMNRNVGNPTTGDFRRNSRCNTTGNAANGSASSTDPNKNPYPICFVLPASHIRLFISRTNAWSYGTSVNIA